MSRAKGNQSNGVYKIKWDKEKINFYFDTDDGLHFYGWWRYAKILHTDTMFNAVDVYVKREHDDPNQYMDVCVDSLTYPEDPRENLQSLNADICAASNRWFYQNFNGEVRAIDQLIKQARYPTIHINQLGTLDRLIMRLKEFRHVAITSGGTRLCELAGDKKNPPLLVSINVTEQAMALKGKAPTILQSTLMDSALRTKRGGDIRANAVSITADPENVKALLNQLKQTRDKGVARKIRAMLRAMGHRGGARAEV